MEERTQLVQRTLILAVICGLWGCDGRSSNVPTEDAGAVDSVSTQKDPYAPCTDPHKCCVAEEMRCEGDGPDGQTICTCDGLWDCSANPNKCDGHRLVPGAGSWDCHWTEFKYSCDQKGDKDNPPPGGGDWTCVWVEAEFLWRCNRNSPPNPSNNPHGAGAWRCVVNNETGQLRCERKVTQDTPKGGGEWKCANKEDVKKCEKVDENGGLPEGGGNWRCSRVNVGGVMAWVCHGEIPKGSVPPGGGSWNCEKVGEDDQRDYYRCIKPDGQGDEPPGAGSWVCSRGTEFNGTVCVEVDEPPVPEPKVGQKCVPGTMMWCDGLQYCGWGQVTCKPDGSWPTTEVNGVTVVDCQELASGARPNTTCACFHFYFNPACCERPDCIVPDGSAGQICPKSAGKLCDYCNPQKPECAEKDAYCLVTVSMETFCGKACASDAQCPANYKCVTIKDRPQKQCLPSDFSCYH